ncbi:MAG: CDP-alcohol phosphatidyltransferase family protein [Chitinophagaceae bacterium]
MIKKLIPNLFTLLNLVLGFFAIICFLGDEQRVLFFNEETNSLEVRFFSAPIILGTIFVLLAGVVDVFDGLIARVLKSTSLLGKELDSLSDMVSFGVAPGILLYKMIKISFATHYLHTPLILFLPVLIFPCAIAYRLAKFNIDNSQSKIFKGMPSPAAGLCIAGLPWATYLPVSIFQWVYNPFMLYLVIFILSYFVVSKYPMMSLKVAEWRNIKKSWAMYLLIIIGIISFILLSIISVTDINFFAMSIVFLGYLILSLLVKPTTSEHEYPKR